MALGMFTGSGRAYDARLDFRPTFGSRGAGTPAWDEHGLKTLLGTGVRGPHIWEGVAHWEAVQTSKHLNITWDGSGLCFARVPVGPYCTVTAPHAGTTYYMTPTRDYTESRVHEIIADLTPEQVGIELDEPEFWSRGGYGEGFKEEWRALYGEEWVDPESSEEARWRASQLMEHLMHRFVRRIFQAVRAARPQAFCMVNPHSPFSYAEAFTSRSLAGDIISTIGELASLDEADAVLAEVWSDTIKVGLVCRGAPSIEPYLHSYVDRSLFQSLGRGTGKQIFQLLDPKSDDPKFAWDNYRKWFEQDTLAALMVGGTNFWVAWTDRIMLMDQPPAGPAPDEYRTVFTTVMNVCRDMERYPYRSKARIGVPVSDTIMWQRDVPGKNYIDAFYALTFPLLDDGVELEVLPIECAPRAGFLDDYKVLLLSFEYWNPQRAELVEALADWVKRGGTLLYYGSSEFDDIPSSWWRQAGYLSARAALFDKLGLPAEAPTAVPLAAAEVLGGLRATLGERFLAEPMRPSPGSWHMESLLSKNLFIPPHYWTMSAPGTAPLMATDHGDPVAWELPVGAGRVVWAGLSPWFLAWGMEGPGYVRAMTQLACERAQLPYERQAAIDVRRGPYRFVYAFGDYTVAGEYLNLLDHELKGISSPTLIWREYAMLYDLAAAGSAPGLLYSSALSREVAITDHSLSASLEGPEGCTMITALRLGAAPASLVVAEAATGADLLVGSAFDAATGILRLTHRAPRGKAALVVAW